MTWDNPPLMIGGGVKHSVESIRLLAHAAFGGSEGIVQPRDLEVRARITPNGTVRVNPGACAIRNRALNAKSEAFAARMTAEGIVTLPATGSGSARTDLIVARIRNPFAQGENYPAPTPEQIANGGYDFIDTYVIPAMIGVAPGTHPTLAQVKTAMGGLTAIPLASVAIPANTGTYTQAMIRDLRQVAQFRSVPAMRLANPQGAVAINTTTNKNLVGVVLDVPEWATHADLSGIIGGGYFEAPTAAGWLHMCLGSASGGLKVDAEETAYDETIASGADRIVLMTAGTVSIPTVMRGTSQSLFIQGRLFSASSKPVTLNAATAVRLEATFKALPESNNVA